MAVLQRKRVQFLLFVVGIIALSITAEKCRQLVGEEAASKSGQFTILNCLDGSSGTVSCVVKEGVKLYFYSIRSLHVETRRNKAIETALADALSQGMTATNAAKVAQQEGAKAAKLATRKAKRIIGPIISSGWDFFEALYFGGTITEGFLRGTGTLFGTYYVGFIGEERFGRFGYLVGSHLGSWVGGRIGLMVYDIVDGIHFMLHFTQPVENQVDEITSNDLETSGTWSSYFQLAKNLVDKITSNDLESSETLSSISQPAEDPVDETMSDDLESSETWSTFSQPAENQVDEITSDDLENSETWNSFSNEPTDYETPPIDVQEEL